MPKVRSPGERCRRMFCRNSFRPEIDGFKVIIGPSKDAFCKVAFQSLQRAAHGARTDIPAPMLYPDSRPQFQFEQMRERNGGRGIMEDLHGCIRARLREVGSEQKGGVEVGFHASGVSIRRASSQPVPPLLLP